MPNFIVNAHQQPNGDHEVHNTTTGCNWMPASHNQVPLGPHPSCHEAVKSVRSIWPHKKINGCIHCCNECHTT